MGNLVGPSMGSLARIVQLDPVRVVFSIPDRALIAIRQKEAGGGTVSPESFKVSLTLANGTQYGERGTIQFIDNEVSAQTGTVAVRALFANPNHILVPGQVVAVNLMDETAGELPVVPMASVLQDRQGKYVYVLNEGNTVSRRPIVTGTRIDNGWSVTDGLKAGETIVVEGLQRIADGQAVSPLTRSPAVQGWGNDFRAVHQANPPRNRHLDHHFHRWCDCDLSLPIQQYPQITPPTVNVSASYPGASAEVIADVVGGPLETAINGVDGMMYMSSTSSNAGQYSLSVTFEVGTDPELAQINVQNRAQLAISRLPAAVAQQGVSVRSRSPDFVLGIAFYSPDDSLNALEITNFATTTIVDALARVPGVGEANVVGASEYSMRVWLNPQRMDALGITVDEVSAAIQRQNIQATLGQAGAPPMRVGTELQYTLVAEGRLRDTEEFGNIVVRTGADGAKVFLRDIARLELGARNYASRASFAGHESAMLQINQSPGANAIQTATAVEAELERLSSRFPAGLQYHVVYDATRFVEASLQLTTRTLFEAFVIVLAVTFIFLQDWRATLISALAIPVSMLGAVAVLFAVGYSLNMISLLALVLAIGLVVDDAILVVENVKHVLEDEPDIPVIDATRKAMHQITGPIISTTLVLLAVVTPTAFLEGIGGQLYRQFAVTISSALVLSSFVALTLSPALAAFLLRHGQRGYRRGPLAWFSSSMEKPAKATARSSAFW